MELIKIKETDGHREYGDASIRLDADEMRAFFGTFARVEREFRQLIANLGRYVVRTTATPTIATTSAATSMRSEPMRKLPR